MAAIVLVVGADFGSFFHGECTHKFKVGIINEIFGNIEQVGYSLLSRIIGFFFRTLVRSFFRRADRPIDWWFNSPVVESGVYPLVAWILGEFVGAKWKLAPRQRIVTRGFSSEFDASFVERQREVVGTSGR